MPPPPRPKTMSFETQPDFWGIALDKWRELAGFVLFVTGFLLLLALVSFILGRHWIGAVGDFAGLALTMVMGQPTAFAVPILLLLAAVHGFRGTIPFHPFRKLFATILTIVCMCGLFALPDYMKAGMEHHVYLRAGVMGNFLLSREYGGMGLGGILGPAGCMVVFISGLVIGAMVSTDFLFLPLVRALVGAARALPGILWGWRRKPAALFRKTGDAAWRGLTAVATTGPKSTAQEIPSIPALDAVEAPDKKSRGRSRAKTEAPDLLDQIPGGEPGELTIGETPAEPEKVMPEEDAEQVSEFHDSDLLAKLEQREQAEKNKKARKEEPEPLAIPPGQHTFAEGEFAMPPLDLFTDAPPIEHEMDREEILQISGELEKALADFNISARVVDVRQGPVVTQYELQPAPGVKVSSILNLENDMALILRAKSVRIQAPIPGKAAIGVEVPNRSVTPVFFKELLAAPEFQRHPSPLAFVLGKNIGGEPVICDLAAMPHLLVAGTTGSGKSVCVNVIISSILYRMPPDKAKFIMIDPKRVELNVYSEIPHLLAPVVNEPRQAAAALMWAVQQMEERLRLFSSLRVRNIDGYNAVVTGKREPTAGADISNLHYLPHIVIIIDELADLMIIAKNEVEDFIVRLAQMSRAAGIHMIIATQRPSVNVLTGIIKANFPSRIAFRVSAKVDSRTILDTNGAETLLGKGDMLFSPGGVKPMRIQGAFLSDHDVERLSEYLREQTPTVYEKEGFSATPEAQTGADASPARTMEGMPGADDDMPGVIATRPAAGPDATGFETSAPPPAFPAQPAAPRPDPFKTPAVFGAASKPIEFGSIDLKSDGGEEDDEALYDKALRMVLESRKPSVSMIQRRLKIGFARAGRLMDLMEERGIVGPYLGSKPRELILDEPEAMLRRLDELERERERGRNPY